MTPSSLPPRTSSSSSSSSNVRSNPSKLPSSSSSTTSLSSIVSNLFQRTSLNQLNATPSTIPPTDLYSDKTIASLLLAEASRAPPELNCRSGTREEVEKEAIRKPNKRFLKGVLGRVEAHNTAVSRAQRHSFERDARSGTLVGGRDLGTTQRRRGEDVDVDEDEKDKDKDDDEQERRLRGSGQEKETDRDRHRDTPRRRDRDKDGDPGDEGRHRSRRRSEDGHDKARSTSQRDEDDTKHRTSRHRDEHRQHRHRRDKDEHRDRHRERSDRHRPREDDKDRSSTKTASNDTGPTTVGLPSKMDKYFAPDYDPLFDVSVENDLTDPTTRLIAPGAFDEWDAMLRTIKEKEKRKLEEKEDRRRTKEREKEGRRRERRRRRGESVGSSDEGAGGEDEGRQGKKIKSGEGKGLMEVEYTRVGGTREWDRGKEHLS